MRSFLFFAMLSLLVAACNDSKDQEKPGQKKDMPVSGSDDEKVKDILDQYIKYTIDEDLDGMIRFVSPIVLEKYQKEDLRDELEQGMHNDKYDVSIKQIRCNSVSDVVEKDGDKFALAKTTTNATFFLKKAGDYEQFCTQFKMQYRDVACNETKKSVSFEMKGEMYVVYSNKYSKWFILSNTDPEGVKAIIPTAVREELGIRIPYKD